MINLSELENDALVEIFNIGVGHAAASMSEIVNEEVTKLVAQRKPSTRSVSSLKSLKITINVEGASFVF